MSELSNTNKFIMENSYVEKIAITEGLIENEILRAKSIHKTDFHSVHEGYAVIKEEVDELWDECKVKIPDRTKLRTEAIQIAAMCLRFAIELT